MARRLRIWFEGAIYHITCRGVERRNLFVDDKDRVRWLRVLSREVPDCSIRLYLYCLMPNHFHLLLETPRANLSQFMHKLETAYTVYFNLRHRRAGHLMQGRYGARLVQGNEYLLKLSRYIHLNPVRIEALANAPLEARLKALRAYAWSSYQMYAGIQAPADFLDAAPLLGLVAGGLGDPRQGYGRFVEVGLAEDDVEFEELLRSASLAIGNAEFQQRVADSYASGLTQVRRPEDAAFRRIRPKRAPEEVLRAVADVFELAPHDLLRRRYRCRARAIAARMLWVHAGLDQRAIGHLLHMGTGASVCQQLLGLDRAHGTDEELKQRIEAVNTRLKLNS